MRSSDSVVVRDEPLKAPLVGRSRPDPQRWAEVGMTLVVGSLTAVLFATDYELGTRKLVVLTVGVTLIWSYALHSAARFARARGLEPFLGAALGTCTGFAVLSLLNYWILNTLVAPRSLLLLAGGVLATASVIQTFASERLQRPRRLLLIGGDGVAEELVRDLRESRSRHYTFAGIVDTRRNGRALDGLPYLGRSAQFVDVVRRHAPDLIVCSSEQIRTHAVHRLLDAGVTAIPVVNTLDFYESAFGRVASHRMTRAWFTSVLARRAGYSARRKRTFDVIVATVGLFVLLPFALVTAAAVRCSGPGPIFFRQVRNGEAGTTFTMIKFRTMIVDAERDGPVWASADDPRVTRVGRMLRRTRLDEIPQFWNVLRGEMSIVGPRPERPEYIDALRREIPFWDRRLLLKPGITGWAQVQHAYTADVRGAARKLAYDLYYLKHRSLALDLLILFQTVKIVVSGSGAR